MKYFKKFNTHSDYAEYAASENMIRPNTSLCVEERDVHYNPVIHDYTNDYLTFEPLQQGTFKFSNTVNYSLDKGETWTELEANTDTPVLKNRQKIMWKATLTPDSTNGIGTFSSSGKYNAMGNPLSLRLGDSFSGVTTMPNNSYMFYKLFLNNTKLISIENLSLVSTVVRTYGYASMFAGCTSLSKAMTVLPATSSGSDAYYCMFKNCSSLVTAPEIMLTNTSTDGFSYMFEGCASLVNVPDLHATTIGKLGACGMFKNCTSLVTAPKLSATSLNDSYNYQNMFQGCTSLVNAPELPATTVPYAAYRYMFAGCTSLVTPPVLSATSVGTYGYQYMFSGCTSLTTAPDLPATSLENYCYNYMFSDCTSLVNVPSILPATTLPHSCYRNMFQNCRNITTAPELPALSLYTGCYISMFEGCSKLNYVKALYTTAYNTNNTSNWLSGVASSGTFVINPEQASRTRGVSGIPNGWTIEEAVIEEE